MNNQITELTFLKMYASRFAIPVPQFIEWPAQRKKIQAALNTWGGAIAKPDILTGGRGKAGAVGKVTSIAEAVQKLQQLSSVEFKGKMSRTSYLVQFVESKYEIYTAITYDSRYLSPAITISLKGGVDVESVDESLKKTFPVDVYRGLDAYQAQNILETLNCPKEIISPFARALVNLWDMFITTGMQMCEINPWRVTPQNKPIACDFKAVFDHSNFKQRNLGFEMPEYPETQSEFEEDMHRWSASSYQGQAHISDLEGKGVLPMTFGGGASTIITETLMQHGGDPMFLADFGGNPPYNRMHGTAERCFKHNLADASVILILGGKANNTRIDVTLAAIADALKETAHKIHKKPIPVVVGRGGPGLIPGLLAIESALEELGWPYTIFGPDTPITMVAEYAAELHKVTTNHK